MEVAVLTANLGKFDKEVENVKQILPTYKDVKVTYYRWTDENFPPVAGYTPRLQYRIPKMFGWDMFPSYDYYLWLDGSMSLQHEKSVDWFLDQVIGHDFAAFRHPWRHTLKQEVDHVEEYLNKRDKYITPRYKNGLHKEQYREIMADPGYRDDRLLASTVFIYRNGPKVQQMMKDWWYHTSRYFTVDQIALPYVLWKNKLDVNVIDLDLFKIPYLTLSSHH